MKYLKKYNEDIESDNDFVITKILEQFPIDEVKSKIEDDSDETDKDTALIDMICWFENTFNKDIENDNDFVVTKITDHFSYDDVKSKIEDDNDETDKDTTLIDMICWFENTFNKDIEEEDYILNRLRQEYDIQ